jgi:hypothetical protein
MTNFSDPTEQELPALAIALEEEDSLDLPQFAEERAAGPRSANHRAPEITSTSAFLHP